MKDLKETITEKLKINRDTKTIITVKSISQDMYNKMCHEMHNNREFMELEEYAEKVKNNNGNPNKFIMKDPDDNTLLDKWLICIRLNWDEGIEALSKEVIEHTKYTLEDLHGYCKYTYNIILRQQVPGSERYLKMYENYFDLFGIDIKE